MKFTLITTTFLIFSIFSARLLANNQTITSKSSFLDKNDLLGYLQAPNGTYIEVKIAKSFSDQSKGFSGVKSHQVLDHQGIFFYYDELGVRSFWMPDTYFDLDIIFLDSNLKIVHLIKNAPHHPGRKTPPEIYRTPQVIAQHVLELKSGSKASKLLEVGQKFLWVKEPHFPKK